MLFQPCGEVRIALFIIPSQTCVITRCDAVYQGCGDSTIKPGYSAEFIVNEILLGFVIKIFNETVVGSNRIHL